MQGRDLNLTTYTAQALKFAGQYDSVSTESVLPGIDKELPRLRGLDVFCGNGRDAHYCATQGLEMDAMDGSHGMLAEARNMHAHPHINYFHDLGPEFASTRARGQKYDFMLMSAGWMHIEPSRRAEALGNLLSMANPGCKFTLSLRHGPAPEDRPMFEVSMKELRHLAALNLVHTQEMHVPRDELGRSNVWWEQVMLRVPHEHEDQLSLIKKTALQSRMSSSHKPALMYCLAKAHQDIQAVSPAHAAVPLAVVLPIWQSIYSYESLPVYGSAANPTNAFTVLRKGPINHMADPATGQPLLKLEPRADGAIQILLPRSLATALKAHSELVTAGAVAAVDRYFDSRKSIDTEARQRIVSRMKPQALVAA